MSNHSSFKTIQPATMASKSIERPAKNLVSWLMLTIFTATLFMPGTALSEAKPELLPLGAASGERLHYDVSWLGITAGNATMKMDVRAKHYTVQAKLATTGMVRVLHSLDELMKAEGVLSALRFQVQRYTKDQRKNKTTKLTTYDFDPDMLQVLSTQNETGRKEDEIQTIALNSEQTVDPLSGFYALRAWPNLSPNSTMDWFVVDGDKIYCLAIAIGGSYRLHTALGWFTAFPVQIAVKNSKKFLNHAVNGDKKGAIVIWLTDDRRRMPVQVEAQMAFGSVVAELVAFDDGRGEKREQ